MLEWKRSSYRYNLESENFGTTCILIFTILKIFIVNAMHRTYFLLCTFPTGVLGPHGVFLCLKFSQPRRNNYRLQIGSYQIRSSFTLTWYFIFRQFSSGREWLLVVKAFRILKLRAKILYVMITYKSLQDLADSAFPRSFSTALSLAL